MENDRAADIADLVKRAHAAAIGAADRIEELVAMVGFSAVLDFVEEYENEKRAFSRAYADWNSHLEARRKGRPPVRDRRDAEARMKSAEGKLDELSMTLSHWLNRLPTKARPDTPFTQPDKSPKVPADNK